MTLNSRNKEMILFLCQQKDFVTYEQMGKHVGVSARTMIREMPAVEKWLKPRKIAIVKKSRYGIRLEADIQQKEMLMRELYDQAIEKIYSKKERYDLILLELLQTEAPLKQYYFSSMLQVSEATVSHDLDKIAAQLGEYNLKLSRKPGFGIQLIGREKDRRKLMVHVFYDYLSKDQLLALTRQSIDQDSRVTRMISQTSQRLLDLVSRENLIKIERVVYEIAQEYQYKLAESAKIGLIVHLALAVERVKKDETIVMQADVFDELNRTEEFRIAEIMLDRVSLACQVEMPREEAGFITMHLKGSKMKEFVHESFDAELTNFQLVRLVGQVIALAEDQVEKNLSQDGQLRNGLVVHLKPALIRLKLKMEIRNPLLEKIKTDYASYFDLARICQKPIETFVGGPLPEAETGYLAMHLGAAIEKESLLKRRKARVVVTCTTGIGSSKMLAMRLQKEFDTLEILEILSTIEMDEDRLIKNGVDLIISTVKTSYKTIPSVIVSPILSTKEQAQVQDAMAMLTLEAEEPEPVGAILKPVDASLWTRDELVAWSRDLQETAAVVEDLMQNFWTRAIAGESPDAVLAAYFKDRIPEELQALTKQKLFEREALGSTIMEKEQILLLHNKVQGLRHLYVGVAVLDSGFWYQDKWIGAVVLLIGPQTMTRVQNDVISQVSRALIESGELIASIREKDPQKIEQVVGQMYYRHIFDRVTQLGKKGRRKNEHF